MRASDRVVALTLRARPAARCLLAALACGLLGSAQASHQEGMDAIGVRDFARARTAFALAPEDPKALFQLARLWRNGQGGPADDAQATALLRKASERGHFEARVDLAYALGNGRGVPADGAEALRLLRTLVEAGHTEGIMVLGKALRYGWWGQPRDEAAGVALFRRAMESGDDEGRLFYGLAQLAGAGLPKDEAAGAALVKQSADAGHLDAQSEYGRLLAGGLGVPKDEAAAVAQYRKAAERDHRAAQYQLGAALISGRGVARDDAAGARWVDASARQGWVQAQLFLGDMFRNGWGVPKSAAEAFVWYSIAARSGVVTQAERANQLRSVLAKDLPEAQLTRLQARSAAFRPQVPFRPRAEALPPVARGERVELGGASLKLPPPKGWVNVWATIDWMQRAYPNDPELRPWLMVLNAQEDLDRLKIGLPGSLRSIEVTRHVPDDSVKVTPAMFQDLKAQLRQQIDGFIAEGRYRSEGVVVDDERGFAIVRAATGGNPRLDAILLVLLKDRVLQLYFTGFTRDHLATLPELVKATAEDLASANRPGLFGG